MMMKMLMVIIMIIMKVRTLAAGEDLYIFWLKHFQISLDRVALVVFLGTFGRGTLMLLNC